MFLEFHIFYFLSCLGDDVTDFKLKKKDRRLRRMEKLSRKAKELSVGEFESVKVKKEVEIAEKGLAVFSACYEVIF